MAGSNYQLKELELYGEAVEVAIDNGNGAGYECRGIAHKVLDCTAEFLRLAHAFERSLTDDVTSALSVAAVRICQQVAFFIGDTLSFTSFPPAVERYRSNAVFASSVGNILQLTRIILL